jgi:sulfatase maturation enzyme AslB (radical SAM superfamily)
MNDFEIRPDQHFFSVADLEWPATSIESGRFIFTLWPSLYCPLNCPHCYLSLEQRRNKSMLSLDGIRTACEKIKSYYETRNLDRVEIYCYWYGGEPTSMPQEYFLEAVSIINTTLADFSVKHDVMSALITTDASWFPIIKEVAGGVLQTSYDGDMRGKAYLKKWEQKVKLAVSSGLKISTTTVVNEELLRLGAEPYLNYLSSLGVTSTGFLPLLLTDHNQEKNRFSKYHVSMSQYCDFLIEITDLYIDRKNNGVPVPEVGQIHRILQARHYSFLYNMAGLVLYLMPNGDFTLPDYDKTGKEYLVPFGNILQQSFENILRSPGRKLWLRKQAMKSGNVECQKCERANACLMEYWKKNRKDDECFGAKRFVDYVISREDDFKISEWNTRVR